MTLCIAAVARKENTLVFVADYMLSNDTNSIEGSLSKVVEIGQKKWVQLFSGDPSHNLSILDHVQVELKGGPDDRDSVLKAYEKTFQKELKCKVESQLLSPLGMTRDEFFAHGREKLGDDQFSRLLYQIQDIGLETDFLVAGFDADNAHLLSITDPGTAYIRDALSFHAIGCGAALADAFLMTLPYDPFADLEDIIYRICETKFKSEAAPGVGKKTTLATLDREGNFKRYHTDEVQKIRSIWEVNKDRPIPSGAPPAIKSLRPFRQSKLSSSSNPQT